MRQKERRVGAAKSARDPLREETADTRAYGQAQQRGSVKVAAQRLQRAQRAGEMRRRERREKEERAKAKRLFFSLSLFPLASDLHSPLRACAFTLRLHPSRAHLKNLEPRRCHCCVRCGRRMSERSRRPSSAIAEGKEAAPLWWRVRRAAGEGERSGGGRGCGRERERGRQGKKRRRRKQNGETDVPSALSPFGVHRRENGMSDADDICALMTATESRSLR